MLTRHGWSHHIILYSLPHAFLFLASSIIKNIYIIFSPIVVTGLLESWLREWETGSFSPICPN